MTQDNEHDGSPQQRRSGQHASPAQTGQPTPHQDSTQGSGRSSSYGRSVTEGDRGSQIAEKAQERIEEYGRKAQQQADAAIDRAARDMERAAAQLRKRASDQAAMPHEPGSKFADTLDRTSGYLKEHDTADIINDLERFVRDHPLQSMAGAVVGGFVLSRLMK